MCGREFSLQNVVNECAKIFRRGYGIRKFRPIIQILQVEKGYNFPLDTAIEIDQIADHAIRVNLPADRNLKHVIVPMPVRVVALAISGAVLLLRHLIAMQAMRCREAVTAM